MSSPLISLCFSAENIMKADLKRLGASGAFLNFGLATALTLGCNPGTPSNWGSGAYSSSPLTSASMYRKSSESNKHNEEMSQLSNRVVNEKGKCPWTNWRLIIGDVLCSHDVGKSLTERVTQSHTFKVNDWKAYAQRLQQTQLTFVLSYQSFLRAA